MIDGVKVRKIRVRENDTLQVNGNCNANILGKGYNSSEIKLIKNPDISKEDKKLIYEIIKQLEKNGVVPQEGEDIFEAKIEESNGKDLIDLFKNLSENEEEKKAQLNIRIQHIIILGKMKSGKENIKEEENKKNLAKLDVFMKKIDDVIVKISELCGKQQDLYLASQDKQSGIKKNLDLLEENLESQKAINGDSYESYTKSVKPFIEIAKREIDGYRKQVQEYKGLSDSATLLEKKLKKAVLEYETESAKMGEGCSLECEGVKNAKSVLLVTKNNMATNLPKMEKELSSFKARYNDGKQKFALMEECLANAR